MRLQFILSEVFQNLRRNIFMAISVVLVTFISLLFVGGGILLQMQITKAKGEWYEKVEVALYMCPAEEVTLNCPSGEEATDSDIENIKKVIETDLKDDVESVYVESKEEVFEEFQKQYPGGVFTGQTLTSDDMQVTLRIKLTNPENYRVVNDVLRGRPGVQTVEDQRSLFEPIFTLLNRFSIIAIGLAVIMLLSAILLITTTIRLSAASRRHETEIMRLVGASNVFIQLPFMIEGMVAAVGGAALASVTLFFTVGVIIDDWLASSIHWINFITASETFILIPILVLIAILLAAISSILTLKKYLKA